MLYCVNSEKGTPVFIPYRKAVQSGITDKPGSEIEDRQYQLDIDGMTMSVGSWKQIEMVTKQSKAKLSTASTTMTQNPALEWNTSSSNLR